MRAAGPTVPRCRCCSRQWSSPSSARCVCTTATCTHRSRIRGRATCWRGCCNRWALPPCCWRFCTGWCPTCASAPRPWWGRCWRQIMTWALNWANRAFPAGEKLLVLGSGETAVSLLRELRLRPQLGLELLGVVSESNAELAEATPLAGLERTLVLGGWQQVGAIIAAQRPRRIVIAMQDRRLHLPFEPLIAARTSGVKIEEAPTLFERITGRLALNSLRPSWFL